ncbi:MAG TPA: peptidoglycan-associated lipoprotein Pal [Burkholderiales bacterium]|jgi:peptidoglycan-associated lipoprotein|nr:peptidoglycan-associated lipoprotein Pal [Burkholderiales bacterium]
MRNVLFVAFLVFLIAGCATQGGKSADIEQRDLFDQQQAQRQQEAARKQETEKQAQVMREQDELKRQLEEQQRRQQGQVPQQEQPIVRPLPDGTVGESQLKSDPWAQLKEAESPLSKRSVYYDYNAYDIKEEYVPLIEAHAKLLMAHPDLKIIVQGNCDDRGSREYNLALGQRRADSVKRAMVLLGVNEKQTETVSFGAEKPVAFGQDEESWAKNRRSDIVYPREPQ